MEKDWKAYIPLYLRVFRTLSIYPVFLLIWLFSNLFMGTFRSEESMMVLAAGVFAYFIFFSVARVFAECDASANLAFVASGAEGALARARVVLCSRVYLFELAAVMGFVLILPFEAGLYPFGALLVALGFSRMATKWILLAVTLPLHAWLLLHARLSAWQKYVDEGRTKLQGEQRAPDLMGDVFARGSILAHGMGEASNTPVNEPTGTIDGAGRRFLRRESWNPSLLLKCLGLLVIYAFGGFGLYFALPVVYSVFAILWTFSTIRWWLPLFLLAAIFALFWGWFALRAAFIRHRLFKMLRRTCRDYGFRMERVKRPYRSLFHYRDGANLRIHANGKVYDCKLFSALRRHYEMFFDEQGTLFLRHTLRFRRVEFLSFTTEYHYDFESEHEKLCIVAPVPKVIYAGSEEWHRPIDTGMRVGDYRIFSSTGLINALRRDCVEKD